ncbi:DUF4402 domain-containing protein [Gaoshiqia sp. Z1-71]|uniref:DUF4402 domain-containing protein n=1 Tax=Gaoshiqia hydrogeniformans TaxID=3290090 RepID=UPI003BF91322
MRFIYCLLACFCCISIRLAGQNTAPGLPQRTATVRAVQELNLGDLTVVRGSSGGTVTVDYDGTRTATGDVVLLNMGTTAQQAIFEFKLCPGRTVILTYPTEVTMTGVSGGTLQLHIGPIRIGTVVIDGGSGLFTSNKGCDDIHLIYAGGAIEVGSVATNPPGSYSGSFQITFHQQ